MYPYLGGFNMRIFNLILAFTFLTLAIMGILLPVLPTTPFLLLSGFFMMKGSTKLHNRFVASNLYKRFLSRNSIYKRRYWILLVATIWIGILIFTIDILIIQILLVVLIIAKYIYFICFLKTKNLKSTNAVYIK